MTFDSGLARTVRVEPSKKPYDFFQGEYEVAGEKRYSYGNSPASACCAAFEYVAEGPSFDAQRIVSVRRADAFSRDLIPSACVLLEQDGLFAVVFSAKHGGAPEVPGGKADSPTETRDETAARELWEEVGVRATELWPLITVDTRTPSTGAIHPCTAYAAFVESPVSLRASKEGLVGWVSREDLLERGTYRAVLGEIFRAYDAHCARFNRTVDRILRLAR